MDENYISLIQTVHIFIDQNIPCKVKAYLIDKGYVHVKTVYDLGYIGANDGKLLRLIKNQKMILVTYDKKFHKMAIKYNDGASILIKHRLGGQDYGFHSIAKQIDQEVQHNFKLLKRYFNISRAEDTKSI